MMGESQTQKCVSSSPQASMVMSPVIESPLTTPKQNFWRSPSGLISKTSDLIKNITSSLSNSSAIASLQRINKIRFPVETLTSVQDLQTHHFSRALRQQEFSLYYQPQIDLETGSFLGVEVLLRWQHPSLGWISPAEFIPLAEQNGFIVPLGEWILFTACSQYQQWMGEGIAPLKLSVNLSPHQLQQPNLVSKIKKILAKTGMPPDCLELEITESCLVDDLPKTIAILNQFKAMGIRTAIDDFGTGYSSLASLKSLPFDTLKIDKSFLDGITSIKKNCTILHSIIELGHGLKIKIIAEGIETLEQLNLLKTLNCDYGQGYFISRPLNLEAIVSFLPLKEAKKIPSKSSTHFA